MNTVNRKSPCDMIRRVHENIITCVPIGSCVYLAFKRMTYQKDIRENMLSLVIVIREARRPMISITTTVASPFILVIILTEAGSV
jgi:hypothetical protein